jgi:hypothetical protein
MSAICRLSAPLAVGTFRAGVAVAETTTIGTVDKVQAHVDATQAEITTGCISSGSQSIRFRLGLAPIRKLPRNF